MLAAAIFTRNDSRVSKTRTRQYAERAICTASPDWAGDAFAAKRIPVLDLVIAHADAFTLREATRQSGASISAAFDGCGSTLFAPGSFPRWTSPVHKVAYKIIRASPPR